MRRRFTRWIIQTAVLWAAQKIARKIVEKMSEPDDKNVRKIAVEYERTGEERVGPAGDSSPPSGSPV
jgi:hypothetical protein